MSNEFFDSGPEHAARVNDLFTRVAARYDLINDLQSFGLHRLWKRRVANLARVKPGDLALDLCCGTGDLALLLARRGARVVGLDFSEAMLARARSRVESLKSEVPSDQHSPTGGTSEQSTVELVQGDAQAVPFESNSFDVVTVGYGLRNLTSWELGLGEMYRVVKQGGRLLVLDFGKPDNSVLRWLYFSYLGLFVPLFGRIFCGSWAAYAYILKSLKSYPAQRGIAERMKQLGLVNVQTYNLLGGAMSINYAEKAAGSPTH